MNGDTVKGKLTIGRSLRCVIHKNMTALFVTGGCFVLKHKAPTIGIAVLIVILSDYVGQIVNFVPTNFNQHN
jgi:hypothetical protein